MLHLQIVQDDGFQERKSSRISEGRIEERIDDGLLELLEGIMELPFAYPWDSCYGVFNILAANHQDRHILPREKKEGLMICGEAYLNFGLECSDQGRDFLDSIKGLIRRYRQYSHLADSDAYHGKGGNMQPNEFHVGVFPSNGRPVQELGEEIEFQSWEEARDFEIIRTRFWNDFNQLVKSSK